MDAFFNMEHEHDTIYALIQPHKIFMHKIKVETAHSHGDKNPSDDLNVIKLRTVHKIGQNVVQLTVEKMSPAG